MNLLGEKLFDLRRKKGYSQEQLAEMIGVTRQTISKWETGSMQPTFENIRLLCEILEIKFEDIANDLPKEAIDVAGEEAIRDEIAISLSEKKKNKFAFPLIFISIMILFLVSIYFTIYLGRVIYTNNRGYDFIHTVKLPETDFYISLILCCISFVALIILIALKGKILHKSKAMQTNSDKM